MPPLIASLQVILAAELAAGNQITETSDWLPHLELLVCLRYRFQPGHALPPSVTYTAPNDPHFWYAEYTWHDGPHAQLLCCGFAALP